jgi:thymidylate kinase
MIKLKRKLIISLMGVDGAGKTTLAKNLHKSIQNSQYLHLKPYIFFLDKRTTIKNPYSQKKSSFILSLIRILVWFCSYKFFFYKNNIKKIYIFDRYVHDILIDPLRYKNGLSKVFTKFIVNFFPKPDLWVFLNPPLKTIKYRKNELTDDQLKRQIKEYKYFFKNKKNVLILSKNMQKKRLITQIFKKIKNLIK